MKKGKKDKHFIHNPVYPGGPKAMRTFLSEQLQYPPAAAEAGISGSVRVKYTINHEGKVIDTTVIGGLGYGCDEEAQRVVKLLRFEVPKNRGLHVLFHKHVDVHFRHDQRPASPPSVQQLRYTITPHSKPAAKKPQAPNSGGYSYIIEL